MQERRAGRRRLAAITLAAVTSLSIVGAGPALAGSRSDSGAGEPKVVASGLDNPRQLSFTRSGDLLVAESGVGGDGPCIEGPEGPACFGVTGAVTKIGRHGQTRILTGLPSLATEGGNGATGPSDVYGSGSNLAVLIGLGGNPAARDTLPAPGHLLGTLIETNDGNSGIREVADLAAYEAETNPIADVDSNPVGLLRDRAGYVVADAGGNTLLRVRASGRITGLAVFPDQEVPAPPFLGLPPGTLIPSQAVPTSVVLGPDNAYYVSQLTGFPFPVGGANIYRVDRRGGEPTVYASGLTNVTDLAFSGDDLYAVQIADQGLLNPPPPMGSVVKVTPGGSEPSDHETVRGDLVAPYGIAIDGKYAYVTTHSVLAGAGRVLKIRL
jgi:hypothetical protein